MWLESSEDSQIVSSLQNVEIIPVLSVLYLTSFPHVLEAIVLCATPFFTFYQNSKNTVCSSTFKIVVVIIIFFFFFLMFI